MWETHTAIPRKRLLNRDGSFNVVRVGLSFLQSLSRAIRRLRDDGALPFTPLGE